MATRNPNDQSRLLDCEDEEDRIRRISRLLSTIDSTSNAHQTPRPLEQLMLPSSSALETTQTSEFQAFLPQIMAANEDLFRRARETDSSVDIEHFDGTEGAYIEMVNYNHCTERKKRYKALSILQNLGLGLFEQRTERSAEDKSSSSTDSSTTTSDTDSTSDPDEEDDTHSSGSDDEEAESPDLIALTRVPSIDTKPGSSRRPPKVQTGEETGLSPTKPLLEPQQPRSRDPSPTKASHAASSVYSFPTRPDFTRTVTTPTEVPEESDAPPRLSFSSSVGKDVRGLSPGNLLQPPSARSQRHPSTVNLTEEGLEGSDRLFDPFSAVDYTAAKHRSSGDMEDPSQQKMWEYLARIRSLQADVAAMHLAMDGHGLGDPWGTTRAGGGRSRSGSMNQTKESTKALFVETPSIAKMPMTPDAPLMRPIGDDSDDEKEGNKKGNKGTEEFSDLNKMFEKKQEALKSVMEKLRELSSVVRAYHELENPVFPPHRQQTFESKLSSDRVVETPPPTNILSSPLHETPKSMPKLSLTPIITSSPTSSVPPSPLPPKLQTRELSPPKRAKAENRRISLDMGVGGGRHGYVPVSPGSSGPPLLPSPPTPKR
ncbi:10042_t:CDS:2 [Acaulospora colombiana]|uniref:10042_t:CDS:1 n=1 Tax=Acaulospora colombiana TaxID=27376 RepID=A0ACA9NC87_9GLOM|nr:10042_t:CDS:2 [Acaulospora colombiana]